MFDNSVKEKWVEIYNYEGQEEMGRVLGRYGNVVLIWDCAFKVIENNLIMGVGAGDEMDELELCYKVYGKISCW